MAYYHYIRGRRSRCSTHPSDASKLGSRSLSMSTNLLPPKFYPLSSKFRRQAKVLDRFNVVFLSLNVVHLFRGEAVPGMRLPFSISNFQLQNRRLGSCHSGKNLP